MEKLSDRLRRLRLQHGLSVRQVAEELAIAPSTYREWENGRQIRGEPYAQLAKVFGVEIYELITGARPLSLDDSNLEKLQQLCSSIVAQIDRMRRNSN